MEIRVQPEPPPREREALEAALARAFEGREDPRTGWWRAGVRENVEEPEAGES